MKVTLIAAVARNGVIGRDGGIPWRLPADLGYFKRTTMGHTLVMGRRTFESSGALPGRTTIILTRRPGWRPPGDPAGVETAASLDRALGRAAELGEDEVFVCGGEEIYRQALEAADRLRITRVDAAPEGDTSFPEIDPSAWRRISREEHPPDERNPLAYAFEVYERKRG